MALAPEQTGIGIRRHFSTEGIDPYDEVTWERRDARIVNFRDGTVAFEQRDVEFPVGWSQNATNIVAQKYFRGTLGEPEREWSLKQVINRVVSTVTAWGRRDGYFVDGAEADAFRDELTTLLLHQRAAFNSPVWFNIGVMGAPQQASACQPYDALVSTPEGLVPIGRLVARGAVGAKVFDAHGLTQVVAVKGNGRKPVLRLHTKAGYQLDVTADHLVWRASGDASGRFVPAGELRAGDQLEWHRTESHGEGEISRQAVAEAALAGWLQGDGFVGRYEGTNRSRIIEARIIEARTVTPAEKAWVLDAIDTVFPDVHRHERRVVTVDTSLDCRRTRLDGAPLDDFVERWDLVTRGVDMTVPEHLFTAPLPVVAAYLRSLFQAAGYVSVRPPGAVIGLGMISHSLVRGVQSLLLRFGIFSRVRLAADARSDREGSLVLSIRTAGDRRRFADEIGFVDPAPAARLEAGLELPGLAARPTKRLEIERVEELGETEVYDIQTESGEYLSGNVRVHNCFILAVDDTMRSILNWYTEEGIIFQGGSGSGVNLSNIRSSYEHLKGGGTASGPVSFMRGADASAGTIKSGGKTRRAAKMVILNADHPDVEDFIWCKAVEERKARVLRDNGFDMDLDGKDSHSTQYQNANNSVRVTDDFMQAVVDDADWHLRAVTTGDPIRTVKARELFRQIAEAAWECADPGMQFDTTINKWHTASNTGRINGSNPCCFTGDMLVDTSWGLVPIGQLQKTAAAGQDLPLAWSFDHVTGESEFRTILRAWVAGLTDRLVDVRTAAGLVLRCTPEHRFLTVARGYVEAQALVTGEQLRCIDALGGYIDDSVASVDTVTLDSPVPVYDLEVDGTHNFCVTADTQDADHAVVVHNSEYMHLDNSACNLASLNLLRFLNDDGSFDVEGFRAAIRVVFTAQEILVGNADYPTERIADTSRRFRQLGLGYANLGALLMALGVAYDSEAGRAWAGAITALMTGEAYATSARTAARMGPFAGYAQNKEPMNRVLGMHRDELGVIDTSLAPSPVLAAARDAWDDAVGLAEVYGVRNSQATVLAPTGTIGLMMDCDTTGIEPDLGLCKTKKLVGGGTMSIVNQTVPRALRRLGYGPEQVNDILAYIDEQKSILGAPHLSAGHLSVFACSMGDNVIHYLGHVKMMAAVQPWISGAISKTVNVPESMSVDEVEQLHIESWRLGLKALAIYRDNCKVGQPLSSTKTDKAIAEAAAKLIETVVVQQHQAPDRERLPRMRNSKTFSFRVADCHGYVTVGEYDDGRPGEIFLRVAKQGSTLAGIMDAFAISVSHGLQYGVPIRAFVDMYTNMRFEPAGMTDDPDIRFASSLVDYIFRRLAVEYLTHQERVDLGILTVGERMQPTLPGVEEEATPNAMGSDVIPDPVAPVAKAAAAIAKAVPAVAAAPQPQASDAPYCYQCGMVMQRAGACFVCSSCGTTSGCS
ncbi:MAG: ribonucleoside-diphosphate reductase alpha chain [Actinomycetota bacterium]|jgi:ribonucleotide reductase alpha subunit|nr:ribonucleoside-diphosphate reductase alpha chain [Actinomycetota bacterium]